MSNRFKTPIRVGFKVDGLDELVRRLKDLDRKAARAAMKKGVGEVTIAVKDTAKALVPARTGLLRKSIGQKTKVARGGSHVYGVVKPRGGAMVRATAENVAAAAAGGDVVKSKDGKRVLVRKWRKNVAGLGWVNPVKYAHLVEFGRVSVGPKSKKVMSGGGVVYGRRAKAVAPRPFMRPAWAARQGSAGEIIKGHVMNAIRAFWEKSRRKRSGR